MTSLGTQHLKERVEEEVFQILISQMLFQTFLAQIFLMTFLMVLEETDEEVEEDLQTLEEQI